MEMHPLNHLWVDGEQIPDDRIEEIFQQPPGLPPKFLRSALIVGARGVGKTTLFRFQKRIHEGIALHISLATEFAPLTRQTGFGPLAYEVPRDLEPGIIGKASALLAMSIAQRLAKKAVPMPSEMLRLCLPDKLRQLTSTDFETISKTKTEVAIAPINLFEALAVDRPLPKFVSALAEDIETSNGPLLLLLDRADMVLPSSLAPLIELLDQSTHFIALIATRPGHAGQTIASASSNAIAGDTYSVVHLGMHPRSQSWLRLVEVAVAVQFGAVFDCIPGEIREMVIAISRDSLRLALELFARYTSVPPAAASDELLTALEDSRENQMLAAQRVLQTYHPNFRSFISKLRKDSVQRNGYAGRPLLVAIEDRPLDSLFENVTRCGKFVEAGLRCGALSMPEGLRWTPGLIPTAVEIPPLLLWEKADGLIKNEQREGITLNYNETDLLRPSGGRKKAPSIFVAYRMRITQSLDFRRNLEAALEKHHRLTALRITDGHVPAGVSWSKHITWIRRENGSSGLKRLQLGCPGEDRFREFFYHR